MNVTSPYQHKPKHGFWRLVVEWPPSERYIFITEGPYRVCDFPTKRLLSSPPSTSLLVPSNASHGIPTEIAIEIASYIEPWSLLQLRSSGRQWNKRVTPEFFAASIIRECNANKSYPFRLLVNRKDRGMLTRNPIPKEAAPIALAILEQLALLADRRWVSEELKPSVRVLDQSTYKGRPRTFKGYARRLRLQFYKEAIRIIHKNKLDRLTGDVGKKYRDIGKKFWIRGHMLGYRDVGKLLGLIRE